MTDEKEKVSPEEEQPAEAPKAKRPKKDLSEARREIELLQEELDKKDEQLAEQNDKYLRMLAEYENFRRRAKEEKDGIYTGAVSEVLTAILPVLDNLDRAANAGGDGESVRKGVQMTLSQFEAVLAQLGVSEVPYEQFDPTLHEAVMHIEDESRGENEIVEVLQKGYKKGDRIIRYAMVKVAN